MENKGYFSLPSSRIHFPTHPNSFFSLTIPHKPFTIFWSERRGTLEQLCSLIPSAVIVVVFVCVCVLCSVLFLWASLFPFSGLALAIRDQEYHGFLFANVGHDCGQLVDVAAVEMLRLPQVQDHRGWARFGCKETHVSAREGEHKNSSETFLSNPAMCTYQIILHLLHTSIYRKLFSQCFMALRPLVTVNVKFYCVSATSRYNVLEH